MKAKYLVIAGLALVTSACGISAKDEARYEMQQTQAAYNQCLRQNSADTTGCKQIYEPDLQTYRTESAGTTIIARLVAGSPPLYAIVQATGSGSGQGSH